MVHVRMTPAVGSRSTSSLMFRLICVLCLAGSVALSLTARADDPDTADNPVTTGKTTGKTTASQPVAAGKVAAASQPASSRPVPTGQVLIEIIDEGMPEKREWPKTLAAPSEHYTETAFGLFHVPWRYMGTGIRADRGNPYLLRATARCVLPAGKHRCLLRARTAARLSVDGQRIAELKFSPGSSSAHGHVRHDALKLGQTRYVAPGDFETLGDYESDGKEHTFVLEIIVGGRSGKTSHIRAEVGETIVAFAPAGSDEFQLLAPRRLVSLTDAGWQAYATERSRHYAEFEAQRRREAFAKQADYWTQRTADAREYALQHPVAVPAAHPEWPASNAVDHFINRKLATVIAAGRSQPGQVEFYRDIKPLLQANCLSCHGSKALGGLRLDRREQAFHGGNSELPALVSGDPEDSELIRRIRSDSKSEAMPPKGDRLTGEQIALLERWVKQGAKWPDEPPTTLTEPLPVVSDLEFLRRVTLDTVGTVPSAGEIREFVSDTSPDRRSRAIDRLLDDSRWADAWMPYWMDVLAENPNMVNPTLNNTGPFRWWLYEALLDNRPWHVVVTELLQMEGSSLNGGPAGFALSAMNDAPFAAKAGIVATAFLGTDMKCARCHDAPFHNSSQADLFHLGAMLARKPISVPATSTVPQQSLPRNSVVKVTLPPGKKVAPVWTLAHLVLKGSAPLPPESHEKDSRAQLAALVTAPSNERFAQVLVNRVWRHYLGRGLVEPPDDWEAAPPSHPDLLLWLARDFVAHGYDLKQTARVILHSQAYQRQATDDPATIRLVAGPARRRLGPEALVDVLHDAFGQEYDSEPLCLDLDGKRDAKMSNNFGQPQRAWEFVYLANDRDRPSLNLPRARAVAELLDSFGWEGDRQQPVTDRSSEPRVLQCAQLANGVCAHRLTRLTEDSTLTELCCQATSPDQLVDDLFLRVLTRLPTATERTVCVELIRDGFDQRRTTASVTSPSGPQPSQPYITWTNHLDEEANRIRMQEEERARQGPPPTVRLKTDWRERAEDLLWGLMNTPELVYYP